jgi:hypothetical protein
MFLKVSFPNEVSYWIVLSTWSWNMEQLYTRKEADLQTSIFFLKVSNNNKVH